MLQLIADALDVHLVGGEHASLIDVLTVVLSPVVALVVALFVTWRTIKNDREQRDKERRQEWLKQLQEQQLLASADFAHRVFQSLVKLERLSPLHRDPSSAELIESRTTLEAARPELSKVQLLFGQASVASQEAAQAMVDSLNSAQVALETRDKAVGAEPKATQVENYSNAMEAARSGYDAFLATVGSAIASQPSL